MKNNKQTKPSIGGQALIEGIMMRGPEKTSVAVRLPDGNIDVEELKTESLQNKYKIFKYPFFRGIGGIIDSFKIGQKALMISAEKATDLSSEEPETKFEKWLLDKFGDKIMKVVVAIASVVGVALALFLFLFLPNFIFNVTLGKLSEVGNVVFFRSIAEGFMKLVIFLAYMILCTQLKDIKRVFMYHGAEHKTIFCYESGEDLTVENVKKHSRFHPRCGTSFLVLMLLVGVIIGMFIPFQNSVLRTIVRALCIPVMVAIGYELIRICGKYNNKLTRAIAKPGVWMQRISTKEPDDSMMEVAIKALEAVVLENEKDKSQNDTE